MSLASLISGPGGWPEAACTKSAHVCVLRLVSLLPLLPSTNKNKQHQTSSTTIAATIRTTMDKAGERKTEPGELGQRIHDEWV